MKEAKSIVLLLMIGFGLAICVTSLPQTARAQADKCQNAKEKEDDDKDDNEKLSPDDAKKVKITLAQAREIALKKVSGTVIDEELEKEKGRLQYAFDICDGNGKIWDVEIDAITGEVLQAKEDDEDGDNDQGNLGKTKKVVYRVANSVKKVTVKTFEKLF